MADAREDIGVPAKRITGIFKNQRGLTGDTVELIGRKKGNVLLIEGKEFKL
jgi:hypothetical protein